MAWWNDSTGLKVGQNAPHNVPAGYVFHGTFNPIKKGWYVHYNDSMSFRVNIGGATGTAYLNILEFLDLA